MVVEIDAEVVRIVFALQNAFGDSSRFFGDIVTGCHDIGDRYAFAIYIPGAFRLMGSDGAAP